MTNKKRLPLSYVTFLVTLSIVICGLRPPGACKAESPAGHKFEPPASDSTDSGVKTIEFQVGLLMDQAWPKIIEEIESIPALSKEKKVVLRIGAVAFVTGKDTRESSLGEYLRAVVMSAISTRHSRYVHSGDRETVLKSVILEKVLKQEIENLVSSQVEERQTYAPDRYEVPAFYSYEGLATDQPVEILLHGKYTDLGNRLLLSIRLVDVRYSKRTEYGSRSFSVPRAGVLEAVYREKANSTDIETASGFTAVLSDLLFSHPDDTVAVSLRLQDENGHERYTFKLGEKVIIRYMVNTSGYLYLLNVDAEGNLLQLFPNRFQRNNRIEADREYRFPDAFDTFQYQIIPPTGEEAVFSFVTQEKIELLDCIGQLAGERFLAARPTELNVKGFKVIARKEFRDLPLDQWNGAKVRFWTEK